MSGCGERESNRMLAPWPRFVWTRMHCHVLCHVLCHVVRGLVGFTIYDLLWGLSHREPHVIAHPHSHRCPVPSASY